MSNKGILMGLSLVLSATTFFATSALAQDTASHSCGTGYVNGGSIVVTTTYTNSEAPGTLNGALSLTATLPTGWTIGGWSATGGFPTFSGTTNWIFSAPGTTPITMTYTVNTVGSGPQNITDKWRHKRAGAFTFFDTFADPNPLVIADVSPTTTTTTTAAPTTTTTTAAPTTTTTTAAPTTTTTTAATTTTTTTVGTTTTTTTTAAPGDTASHSCGTGYVNGGSIVVTTTYTNSEAPGTLNGALSLTATLPTGWTISNWSATGGLPTFSGTTNWVFSAPGATPITMTYTVNTVGSGPQSITDKWRHKRAGAFVFFDTFADPNPLVIADVTPPEIVTFGWLGSGVELEWSSTTARTYSVQATTSLYPTAVWSNVPGLQSLPGSNGTMSSIHSNVPGAQGFYRVRMDL